MNIFYFEFRILNIKILLLLFFFFGGGGGRGGGARVGDFCFRLGVCVGGVSGW